MELQTALQHSPRRHGALVKLRFKPAVTAAAKKGEVAKLVGLAELKIPSTLHMLVAIDATLLGEVEPTYLSSALCPADVIVQLSGNTRRDLLIGLRTIAVITQTYFYTPEEILGGEILFGQEAFGFYDGPDPGSVVSKKEIVDALKIEKGNAAGGSWLLYQQYAYGLENFWRMPIDDRRAVIGGNHARKDLEDTVEVKLPLPANAHTKVVEQTQSIAQMIRRSFPYRKDAQEGLIFLGASKAHQNFDDLLRRMQDQNDGVLEHTTLQEQRIYFVPSADFKLIDPDATIPELPASAAAITVQSGGVDIEIESYEVVTAFREFIKAVRDNVFPDSEMAKDARALFEALAWIGTGGVISPPELKGTEPPGYAEAKVLLDKAELDAKAYNALAGRYMTLS